MKRLLRAIVLAAAITPVFGCLTFALAVDGGRAMRAPTDAGVEITPPVVSEGVEITPPAFAGESDLPEESAALPEASAGLSEEQTDELEGALTDEARDLLGDTSPVGLDGADSGLDAIFSGIKENGLGILKTALRSGALMLTVVLLVSLAVSAMGEGGARDAVTLAGAVGIAALAVDSVNSFIGLGLETLRSISDFSKALLPMLCTAAVSAGAFTSASAKYAATAMFVDVLVNVGTKVILPLIGGYTACVIAGAALGGDTLTRLADGLKWACTSCLTLLVLAFTAYLSLTGIITGKADEVAAKAAKSALETLLPVVGGAISGAAETLVAGAGILRNSIGVFGLLGVCAVCLLPVLRLGAHYLVFKGTAALAGAVSDKRMADLIDGIGTAFGLVLGLVGAAGIMLFVSVYSSMRAMGAA
ncbi:MAG: stage III sporulation protein AE [Oscillospiraceae bacterium]|jgi:stage III sporulation protein AE|nr:stage III sporulation protein AE [Oscillospiraceae bacterium]